MSLNSPTIHASFISPIKSCHAVTRRGRVRKHSRISDEKEVSHGYEEVEEEEDVEVILPARCVVSGDTAVGFQKPTAAFL
jgi:hypothetical protein